MQWSAIEPSDDVERSGKEPDHRHEGERLADQGTQAFGVRGIIGNHPPGRQIQPRKQKPFEHAFADAKHETESQFSYDSKQHGLEIEPVCILASQAI